MTAPQRIQRRRTKGWTMPEHTAYVGRPTYWQNPFRIGQRTNAFYGDVLVEDRQTAVDLYRRYIHVNKIIARDARALRGWNLACWCPLDEPCHADVLLALANKSFSAGRQAQPSLSVTATNDASTASPIATDTPSPLSERLES